MRTGAIGIVGGVGPYAGLDLMRKIMDQTPARKDQEHLPILHFCCPDQIPDRTEFLCGRVSQNPGEALGRIMAQLVQAGATVLGIPCNTAHAPAILDVALRHVPSVQTVLDTDSYSATQSTPPVRFVHMIDAVGEHLRTLQPAVTTVGLLSTMGTAHAGIYPATLSRSVTVLVPDASGLERVQLAITSPVYGLKAQSNPVHPNARNALLAEARSLITAGAQAVILGCTEIPLALTEPAIDGVPLVDATAVLAQSLIASFLGRSV